MHEHVGKRTHLWHVVKQVSTAHHRLAGDFAAGCQLEHGSDYIPTFGKLTMESLKVNVYVLPSLLWSPAVHVWSSIGLRRACA